MNEHRRARRVAGFTLIELILTIAIVVLLGMLLGPKLMNAYPKVAVESEGIRLRADLAYAQQLAIAHNQNYRIIFDSAYDRIIIQRLQIGGPPGSWTFVSQRDLASGVDLVASTFTGGRVDFNLLGEPSEPGTVTLRGRDHTVVRVTVKPGTGMVIVTSGAKKL